MAFFGLPSIRLINRPSMRKPRPYRIDVLVLTDGVALEIDGNLHLDPF